MKKKVTLLAVCMLLMTVSFAQALPLYTVSGTDGRIGEGGPFLITGNGQSFETFCIETEEYVNLTEHSDGWYGTYYGSVDNKILYSSGAASNEGTIATETAKLYSFFLDNYSTLDKNDKRDIQIAIWDYQDQPGYDGTQGSNPFYSAAPTYALTHTVLALNLWTNQDGYEYDSRAQSMLTAAVSEPGSMMLLGLGLVGLAGIRRKFKK